MEGGVFPGVDAMVAVRIELRFKLFVGCNQRRYHVVGILRMDIVVGHAMDDQQPAFQFSGVVDG